MGWGVRYPIECRLLIVNENSPIWTSLSYGRFIDQESESIQYMHCSVNDLKDAGLLPNHHPLGSWFDIPKLCMSLRPASLGFPVGMVSQWTLLNLFLLLGSIQRLSLWGFGTSAGESKPPPNPDRSTKESVHRPRCPPGSGFRPQLPGY